MRQRGRTILKRCATSIVVIGAEQCGNGSMLGAELISSKPGAYLVLSILPANGRGTVLPE
jgi:hypothetical protein